MMRLFVTLLLLLLLAQPAFAADHEDSKLVVGAIGWMVISQGAEFGSTMYLLGQCNGQGDECRIHEGNSLPAYVLSRDPTAAAAAHAAMSFGIAYLILKIHPDHPRLAAVFASVGGAVFTGIAWHNRNFIQESRRR